MLWLLFVVVAIIVYIITAVHSFELLVVSSVLDIWQKLLFSIIHGLIINVVVVSQRFKFGRLETAAVGYNQLVEVIPRRCC